MVGKSENNLNLLDFGIVGEQMTISELLHSSYLRGRVDFQKEVEVEFKKNIQSAAHSSSLLKSKLSDKGVEVMEMYLKIMNFNSFKCLVILKEEDFYSKTKRWDSYQVADHINNTNSKIDLTFSFMSNSEELSIENVTSDGFIFKYGSEKV